MADSAGTSDSADSSAAKRSSPVSSDADRSPGVGSPGAQLRVDFYVLEEASVTARLRLGCKLAEKAYLSAQRALVRLSDAQELGAFDELLWTFMEGSFVPHDVPGASAADEAPVLLSTGAPPPGAFDIIINLAPDIPGGLEQTRRVAEIVDGEETRRRAGRSRFKAYRELGVVPASHNIRAE
ncbi:MAG TPA: DNA polymerase III subunit chi [Steroidobacteraceae bacterium]|nr:DNA polymerase III subunit chi [Steroidobacteraceae bacterium]